MISQRSQSAMVSITVHTGIVALLLVASTKMMPVALITLARPSMPLLAPRLVLAHGSGGGGGMHSPLPASKGSPPKATPHQFVPPSVEVLNIHPKLIVEASIEAPPTAEHAVQSFGDPLSSFTALSAGGGGPLGIGNGKGTGIGDRRGAGIGSGDGGLSNGVYQTGKGVSAPELVYRVEPEFSDEARKAKHGGTVLMVIEVDATGHARNMRILQSLGMGLDEKALEAVAKWRFKPGMKDGKPVPVAARVEVMFHIL